MDENPLIIQRCPPSKFKRSTPLVLIHDGGGTIFSYLRLGSLNRDVWAIQDPHFSTGEPWKGGFDEIADHYIDLIRSVGIRGPILLGGWSLGGYLSMVIANKLGTETSPQFSVVGVLLIDTPFHIPMCKLPPCGPDPDFDGLPELVHKSFDNYDALLDKWELPLWNAPACQGKSVRFTVGNEVFVIPGGSILYKPLSEEWRPVMTRTFKHDTSVLEQSIGPPPAILLKCIRRTPTSKSSEEPCHVDRYRHESLLRWDGNHPDFIKVAMDLDTHHFNIFDSAHLESLTQKLDECLKILDSIQVA